LFLFLSAFQSAAGYAGSWWGSGSHRLWRGGGEGGGAVEGGSVLFEVAGDVGLVLDAVRLILESAIGRSDLIFGAEGVFERRSFAQIGGELLVAVEFVDAGGECG
jgi:hypothetical protein